VIDFMAHRDDTTARKRLASQLRSVLVDLGPSFVKLGQLLSSRVDLLPQEYVDELRSLTDKVRPFPTREAREVIQQEWHGLSAPIRPEDLPDVPVAAASLGQVYRVETPGGTLAVKVQRPGAREQICLDMFVVRTIAPLVRRSFLNADIGMLVDEYGSGFVNELDYVREAESALAFEVAIQRLGLSSVVFIATPLVELTTGRILVTRWVDGERIDSSRLCNREGARLCSVALTAYLAMLLEMGQLHADPHPGNLLRSPDGRLVILDWGLVTTVTPNTQVAIVSYIAHLLAEDYNAIPQDLVDLGFISEEKRYLLREDNVVKAISGIFRGLASGGGARKRVRDIMPEIRELRRENTNILELPTYFAYILRAFSLLEGVGLEQDPEYRIAQDCYPYLISWLLREEGSKTQKILEALLYEPRDRLDIRLESSRPPLSARRLKRLLEAFEAYMARSTPVPAVDEPGASDATSAGSGSSNQQKDGRRKGQLIDLLRQLVKSEAFKDLAVNEFARTVDVLARELHEAVAENLLCGGFLKPVAPKTEEDKLVLDSLEVLATALFERTSSGSTRRVAGRLQEVLDEQVIKELLAELSESSAEVSSALRQLVGVFATRIASRLDSVDLTEDTTDVSARSRT